MAQRVIYDGDFGIDDAMALLVLTARPDVEVVAVGSVHGNTAAPQAARNALAVLDVRPEDVPVAVGAERPLGPASEISGPVNGSDGLGGGAPGPTPSPVAGLPAAMQLVEAVRAEPGACTVVASGPLTNLALAVLLDPEIVELVHRVVVMGGTLRAPGNITPWAEANIANVPRPPTWRSAPASPHPRRPRRHHDGVDRARRPGSHRGPRHRAVPLRVVRARPLPRLLRVPPRPAGLSVHDPTAAVLAVEPDLAAYLEVPIGVERPHPPPGACCSSTTGRSPPPSGRPRLRCRWPRTQTTAGSSRPWYPGCSPEQGPTCRR